MEDFYSLNIQPTLNHKHHDLPCHLRWQEFVAFSIDDLLVSAGRLDVRTQELDLVLVAPVDSLSHHLS